MGTAIAQLVSNNVNEVFLHGRRKEVVENILKTRLNLDYYPNILLSTKINPKYKYEPDLKPEIIFLCVPSFSVRHFVSEIHDFLSKKTVLVSTAKGIEYPSTKTMSEIIYEETGSYPVIFSGPNFASEIILNLPTTTIIASKNKKNVEKVEEVVKTQEFIPIISDDVIGVEMCGVLKNINAIAYGICEGMRINNNAKYALLTKGFNEIKEIIATLGGNPQTVDSYCGFGDIVLTSTSPESRNHTLGVLYGQGIIVDEKASSILFEGKKAIKAVNKICNDNGIRSYVTKFTHDVLIKQKTPKIAFKEFWRQIK